MPSRGLIRKICLSVDIVDATRAADGGGAAGSAPADERVDTAEHALLTKRLLGDADDPVKYTARHDGTNAAWYRAAKAVVTGSIVLPEKGKRTDAEARARALRRYSSLCATHVPDHARPRQGRNGVDILYETKVGSPHNAHLRGAGKGMAHTGGSPGRVGHTYAFGSTLEYFRRVVFGTANTGGSAGDPPLNHSTGVGWVRAVDGDYVEALERESQVFLLLHEIYGGMHEGAARHLVHLSSLAEARDDTPYHDPPGSKRLSYLEHWARELSLETAIGDAARVAATTAANRRKRRADGSAAVEP